MIYSSQSYREAIKYLTKKKKLKYYRCLPQIIEEFLKGNSFAEVWEMNYSLRTTKHIKLSKIRLPNPTMKKGKSGGFRLILLLDNSKKNIVLLYVFPKIGIDQQINITDSEEEKLLKSYFLELKAMTLEKINFSN